MKKKRRVHNGSFKKGNAEYRKLRRDERGRFIRRDTTMFDIEKIEQEVDEFLEKLEQRENED